MESSDGDLGEIICLGSLCSIMIPKISLSAGISTADIVADNPVYHIDLSALHDNETVIAGSKSNSKTYCLNKINITIFYDDSPQAQMDDTAGVPVRNLISLLHNAKFVDAKFKSNVHMHGTTFKLIITPHLDT